MAVLADADRARVWRGVMRYWSRNNETVASINKPDVRAAIDAIDSYLDTNATAINNALPAIFKANATTAQKAVILSCVALARYDIEALRRLIGEID